MAKRERAPISDPFVGQRRYELYQKAIRQFNNALEMGYYLEAITICESLITDRLESRCGELNHPHSFKNIGALLRKLDEIETDNELRQIIFTDLDDWRRNRNIALHEIVKFEKNEIPNWENRVENSKIYAEDGIAIFRSIDNRMTKLRKNSKPNV